MSVLLSAANTLASGFLNSNDMDILQAQTRIATGKEVNSATDDPVRYFRSLDLNRRAAKLADVSKSIDAATVAIKSADSAMNAMRSSLDTLLKTINEARGTSTGGTGNGTSITGTKLFAGTATTINRIAATSLFSATNDVQQAGKSIADTVRSKFIFDNNGTSTNNSSAVYDGNLGIAAAEKVGIRITVGANTYTYEAAASTNGKDLTVGAFIDGLNAYMDANAPALAFKMDVGYDGKMRYTTAQAANTNIKLNFATGPAAGITYPAGTGNTAFGWAVTDQTAGVTTAVATAYDASMIGTALDQFQDGDAFTVSTTDKTGLRQSFTFQAAATRTTNAAGAGTSASNPYMFTTLGDLVEGINATFGRLSSGNRINADVAAGATPGNFALKMSVADVGTALQIQQIQNNDASAQSSTVNGITTKTSQANLLTSIFGAGTTGTAQTLLDAPVTVDPTNRTQMQYQVLSFAPSSTTAADPKRRAAQDAWNVTMSMFDKYFNDSKMTSAGQAHILNGEALRVNLGDASAYTISLSKIDRASLGLAPSGQLTFGTDSEIDNYSAVITSALNTITTQQSSLAQNAVGLNSYQGFVNSISTLNQTYAENITRADTEMESNKLKSLQTMQQMIQAMMSINNSMDGGATRLLY